MSGGGSETLHFVLLFEMTKNDYKNVMLKRLGVIEMGGRFSCALAYMDRNILVIEKPADHAAVWDCSATEQIKIDLSKPLSEKITHVKPFSGKGRW